MVVEDIQKVPAMEKRPETGVMQFGDDWPGYFIRGDVAIWYGRNLKSLLKNLPREHLRWPEKDILKNFAESLISCEVGGNSYDVTTDF